MSFVIAPVLLYCFTVLYDIYWYAMKQLLIFILLLHGFSGYAQKHYLKNVKMQMSGNDLMLEVTGNVYAFKEQVEYKGHYAAIIGSSYIVSCYYEIPIIGFGFPDDNILTDTINLGVIPAHIKEIYISMYTLEYDDTIPDTIYQSPTWTLFLPLNVVDRDTDNGDIRIYPNPNNGNFILETPFCLSSKGRKPIMVEVMNGVGQILLRDDFSVTGSVLKRTINMTDTPPGIYLLRLHTDEGILTKRFSIE